MFQLTKLRKELRFNKEMGGIINVLEGVASAEFYRLQKTRKNLEETGDYLKDFFQMVNIAGARHVFLEESTRPPALLLITSDSGFLGKLNISVVNAALEECSGNEKLVVVGKQGARYIEETGKKYVAFSGISDEVDYKEAEKLSDYIVSGFLDKRFGRTVVVYPHFVSFSVWQVQIYQLLPCRFLFRESSKPEPRHFEKGWAEEEGTILEPSLPEIIEYLAKIWINYMLYGIFWESKLSEWAARVTHLERSSTEIKQLDRKLHFQYFRLLHEISDKNIREIFASRLAVRRMK